MRKAIALCALLVCAAVPAPAGASYSATVTADSPTAYWRLGEASGTNANDEIGTNDGTYAGATLGVTGAIAGDSDTAVTLNGTSSSITIPSGVGTFSGGPLTAEAWVKTSDNTAVSQMIFGAYNITSPYPGWGLLYNQSSADHKLAFFTPGGGWVKSTGTITDTAWHYVAAKITTGGSVTFYIDGTSAGTASSTVPNSYTGAKAIGSAAGGGSARFKGSVDEAALYAAALSDAQVAAHYAAGTTAAAHYYVSPTGSDTNNGTSTGTPWQTIAKVNAHTFVAGDEVSFQGGQSFTGEIAPNSGGTTATPIVFDSYGTGRATITNTGANAGLFIGAFGGVTVQDLNFTGPGVGSSTNDGIVLFQSTGTQVTAAVKILRVDVSGWKGGIGVGGTTKGYAHVTVDEAELHGNRDYGFVSYGPTFTGSNYANADITITRSNAYSNLGNSLNTTTHTGDGIAVGSTDGALIERSSAHDNGVNNTAVEGPEGLWTYDSNAVTIRRSISYANKTSGPNDGGGYDLDQNVTNALLQDNLAWGNDGPGFVVSAGGAGSSSNTIDGVSSVGNNLDGNAAELLLFASISTLEVKNSTFLAQGSTRAAGLGTAGGATLTGVTVHDNVIVTSGTGALVDANSNYSTSSVLFSANGYHRSSFLVKWPTATSYTSKAAWSAATGQEP